jgi:ribosomal-protein-serine acetyltransferase
MFTKRVDDRMELAMVELRDADEVFAAVDRSRDYLRQWLPWVDSSLRVDDTRAFIREALQQHAQDEGFQCVIRLDGNVAGLVGFRNLDWANRRTEIGYWLAEDYQGQGIMTACCRSLVDFAFGELGLNRVEIHAATGNRKSRAIPERMGFTLEGTHREVEWVNDRFVDGAVYALLRSEWEECGGLSTDATEEER